MPVPVTAQIPTTFSKQQSVRATKCHNQNSAGYEWDLVFFEIIES